MGSLERRLRALEERDAEEGLSAALARMTDEDAGLLASYCERVVDADGAGAARPNPTPEEEAAWERLEDLRRQAVRERWEPPPWRAC